ncbi:MAG: flagellin FliC [Bdellovibrionales bacterium]|nr:flagellin FliC [Bdellovibrionales bacterium]
MAITINTNTAALSAQRYLAETTSRLGHTFERLSSGLRIVRASDDAAGLAIADSLRADSKIAGQAIRNASDGISLVSIADGALNEIGNILTRMAELAEQAANGTLSTSQRSALQSEFVSLGSEIERITVTTEFNDLSLINGGSDITLQVGLDSSSNSQITINAVDSSVLGLGIGNGTGALVFSLNDTTDVGAQAAAQAALDAVTDAVSTLTAARGVVGAAESRLNVAVSNLQIQRENFINAESQIRDVDVASEAAELTRLTILQQAGAAVLAQANEQPALALQLLS